MKKLRRSHKIKNQFSLKAVFKIREDIGDRFKKFRQEHKYNKRCRISKRKTHREWLKSIIADSIKNHRKDCKIFTNIFTLLKLICQEEYYNGYCHALMKDMKFPKTPEEELLELGLLGRIFQFRKYRELKRRLKNENRNENK